MAGGIAAAAAAAAAAGELLALESWVAQHDLVCVPRAALSLCSAGTQFTSFTSTKIQMLTARPRMRAESRALAPRAARCTYSVYLIY